MSLPYRPAVHALRDLQHLTPARIGLGRTGASLPTKPSLEFALDHARARDAVHVPLDAPAIVSGLEAIGVQTLSVTSQAVDRDNYLRRPDRGRELCAASRDLLASHGGLMFDLAIVVGDGLSPQAVNAHAIEFMQALIPRLDARGIDVGMVVVATQARVALGDEIGSLLGARMVLMLIGERPGLSVPFSMGAYLTYAPAIGITDASRNCVSNIHASGLDHGEAAFKIAWLIGEALTRQVTGVALKDESGSTAAVQLGGEDLP